MAGPGTGCTASRRTLHTGEALLTEKQRARLDVLFEGDDHVQVETTWVVYQKIVAAYRDPDRAAGRSALQKVITAISRSVPAALTELRELGSTLKRRAGHVLAYLDHPRTSNGPTEAICECGTGWSGTGQSGWFLSRCPACDSRSNWPVLAVPFR